MVGTKLILIGFLVGIMIISSIPQSEAKLWDLIIYSYPEKHPIDMGDTPVIVGRVVDHAGKPVSNVELKIRSGHESVTKFTNSTGDFRHEFTDSYLIPGTYIVNIVATSQNQKIGVAYSEFQVRGEMSLSDQILKKLESKEARQYLHANPDDFENDPIGIKLYNYYQGIYAQLIEKNNIQKELDEKQEFIQKQKEISNALTQKIIEEKNPHAGTFSGWKYDRFVDNLDPQVKDVIVNQLNYTNDLFDAAQQAMRDVLENGGTMEEARQAYIESAAISREQMNNLTLFGQIENVTEGAISNNTNFETNLVISENISENQTNSLTTKTDFMANSILIDIDPGITRIYLNINGTVIELFVNGTTVTQVTNSTQN